MTIMQYNNKTGNYEAVLADGSLLIVDSDVYAEQEQAGVDPRELEQSSTWENCLDGERVRIEAKKNDR
jgi:hypothetical protein